MLIFISLITVLAGLFLGLSVVSVFRKIENAVQRANNFKRPVKITRFNQNGISYN